ncbi:MAG: ankyrin repeat domain-containing protein [Synergistaceae bacterium]|nr:ankyrin repeat domain-containing protein [Synergistaceae bacterium]
MKKVLPAFLCAAVLAFRPLPSSAFSPLAVACARGDVLAVRELLAGGENPNGYGPDGRPNGYTPLMHTIRSGLAAPLSMHLRIAELLLQAGADVDARVPLEASEKPGEEPGEEPQNSEETVTALHWAVAKGEKFLEMTLLLLENGADPNLPGILGRPLHVAAASKRARASHVELLLRWGADARLTNHRGVDPLAEAVTSASPDPEKVRLLIGAGSDVNAMFDWDEFQGINVLMAAAINGPPEIVQALLDGGARKYAVGGGGRTAFEYAVMKNREENAGLLR